MPALLHLGICTTSWALGLNDFHHPYTFQVSYVFPPSTLVPLILFKFLAEHVNAQLRLLILVAPCWMEAPWLPTVLNVLVVSHHKRSYHGSFGGPCAKGSAMSALTLWLFSDVLCR